MFTRFFVLKLMSCLLFLTVCPMFLSAHELVEVRRVNPRIQIDMRYATRNNVFGRPVYPFPGCFLVREVADKLSRVQEELERQAYGLRILDAYRPISMESPIPIAWGGLQQDGCRHSCAIDCEVEDRWGHNRGTSVDVTLVCLGGGELLMPTDFGDPSGFAHADCQVLPANVYHNKQLLDKAMRRQGFVPSPVEWWHFEYKGWSCYPVLDIKFEDLLKQSS